MSISELGCQDSDIHLTSCIRCHLFCSSRAEMLTGNVLSLSISCKPNNDHSAPRSISDTYCESITITACWWNIMRYLHICLFASSRDSPLRILKAILISFPHSNFITFANTLLPMLTPITVILLHFYVDFYVKLLPVLSRFSALSFFRSIYRPITYDISYSFLRKREGALT